MKKQFRIRINCPDWLDIPLMIIAWMLMLCWPVAVFFLAWSYSWWFLLLLLITPGGLKRISKKQLRFEEWKKKQRGIDEAEQRNYH